MHGFFRLPVRSSRTDMPIISSDEIDDFVTRIESGAARHWALTGTQQSLFDMVAGKPITIQGSATSPGSFFSLQLTSAQRNALISDVPDAKIQTQCVVFRVRSGFSNSLGLIFGSLDSANHGSAVYIDNSTSTLTYNVRPSLLTRNGTPYSPLLDKWIFAALSETGDSANLKATLYIGIGDVSPFVSIGANTLAKSTGNKLAIGNAFYSSTGATPIQIDVAEYIIFPYALSSNEIAGVHRRAQARALVTGKVVI